MLWSTPLFLFFCFFFLLKQPVLGNRHIVPRNIIKCCSFSWRYYCFCSYRQSGNDTEVDWHAVSHIYNSSSHFDCIPPTYSLQRFAYIKQNLQGNWKSWPWFSSIYFNSALSLLIPCAESMFPPVCSPNLYASVTAKPIYYQMLWESTHFLFSIFWKSRYIWKQSLLRNTFCRVSKKSLNLATSPKAGNSARMLNLSGIAHWGLAQSVRLFLAPEQLCFWENQNLKSITQWHVHTCTNSTTHRAHPVHLRTVFPIYALPQSLFSQHLRLNNTLLTELFVFKCN